MTGQLLEVKSKFHAEFRRFCIQPTPQSTYEDLYKQLEQLHGIFGIPFVIQYQDPKDSDLLPINNDSNYQRALSISTTILRLFVQRKGESYGELNGYGTTGRKKNTLSRLMNPLGPPSRESHMRTGPQINILEDFRRVSSIIDVDILPETLRRVKLMRNAEKPLGFYIRDGVSMRVMPTGIEKVASIFISRLVQGGLAESTGLLAVNDEVMEVNGIEVRGKSLDQVTDMMVANSSNLIITVKPVNQNTCLPPRHHKLNNPFGHSGSDRGGSCRSGDSLFLSGGMGDTTRLSGRSGSKTNGGGSMRRRGGDEDEVKDFSGNMAHHLMGSVDLDKSSHRSSGSRGKMQISGTGTDDPDGGVITL